MFIGAKNVDICGSDMVYDKNQSEIKMSDNPGVKVFKCKECGKPFYFIVNKPEYIIDDAKEIKKYLKEGYEFEDLQKDDGVCLCVADVK